jgi:plasmid stabilization system protein ParE
LAYSIQITLPARRDARAYAAFLRDAQHSPDAAARWLNGLYAAIQTLAGAPHRFAVIPEAAELGFPYRAFVYHSHRVIYAVDDAAERVTVHRVYHGARNALTEEEIS